MAPRSSPRLLLVLLLLTAFTLVALDLRSVDGSPFDPLRRGADTVLGPVQRALGGAAGDADEQVQELREENARLSAELRRSEALQRRVDELDRLLGLTSAGSYPTVPARVVAVGSTLGFGSTVTLDVGSRDGVEEGQTVVGGGGLVGRTLRVGPFTSTVLLLTDPGSTVGARLAAEGTLGLAIGNGEGLTYEVVEGGRVQVGDGLVTTGAGTYAPGVPVGRVTAVDAGGGALVPIAQVEPYVDLVSLDLVGVITQPPRSTPRDPLPAP